MAESTRQHTGSGQSLDFADSELRGTLEEYLREESKNGANFWNFSTITGLALVFIAMSVLVQTFFGNTFGISLGPDLSGLLGALPITGGLLLLLVGFGLIASEKKEKKKMKSTDRHSSPRTVSEDPLDQFLYPEGNEKSKKTGKGSSFTGSSKKSSESGDSYAYSQKKKLFKSRSDKNLAGVCGGLAHYFGISSTTVRLIFAIGTVLGYGSFILIYIALAIALPKEPIDLMHDFTKKDS